MLTVAMLVLMPMSTSNAQQKNALSQLIVLELGANMMNADMWKKITRMRDAASMVSANQLYTMGMPVLMQTNCSSAPSLVAASLWTARVSGALMALAVMWPLTIRMSAAVCTK